MRAVQRMWWQWGKPRPTVNVIKLAGVISDSNSARSINIRTYQNVIDLAFETLPQAVAVVINSPGGSPVQSTLLHDRIRYHADKTKIPVWTFAEDVAASGGYWIMCAGDELFATPSSIVGSIGVVHGSFGLAGLINKIGVERRLQVSVPRKAQNDIFSPRKEEDTVRMKELLAELHTLFTQHVVNRRGKKLTLSGEELHNKVFNGDIFLGAKAKELGLIDEVGDIFEIAQKKLGPDVKINEMKRSMFRFGMLPLPGTLVNSAVDHLLDSTHEAMLRARFGL